MRIAKEIVRSDREHDRVRAGDLLTDALLAQTREHIRSLRAVDAEVHRLDLGDAVCFELRFEAAGDPFAGFVSGTVRERVSERDDVEGCRHGWSHRFFRVDDVLRLLSPTGEQKRGYAREQGSFHDVERCEPAAKVYPSRGWCAGGAEDLFVHERVSRFGLCRRGVTGDPPRPPTAHPREG